MGRALAQPQGVRGKEVATQGRYVLRLKRLCSSEEGLDQAPGSALFGMFLRLLTL